ncbi:MAG: hypothetical protein IKD11_02010 [Oscillospiraceae bacterium]|nr:hypothetical protein [Oscillospiraceae bacterium]
MTSEKILNAIENGEYSYYGIRVDDGVDYSIGDAVAASRVWVDGDPTDEDLDGTSCIGLKFNATVSDVERAIKAASIYYGDRIYLIGGDDMEYGEDAGEYIIKDAVVVEVLK